MPWSRPRAYSLEVSMISATRLRRCEDLAAGFIGREEERMEDGGWRKRRALRSILYLPSSIFALFFAASGFARSGSTSPLGQANVGALARSKPARCAGASRRDLASGRA